MVVARCYAWLLLGAMDGFATRWQSPKRTKAIIMERKTNKDINTRERRKQGTEREKKSNKTKNRRDRDLIKNTLLNASHVNGICPSILLSRYACFVHGAKRKFKNMIHHKGKGKEKLE